MGDCWDMEGGFLISCIERQTTIPGGHLDQRSLGVLISSHYHISTIHSMLV